MFFFISCSNETIYSGKILNQEQLNNLNLSNKNLVKNKFGHPSFIDPIEQKFFYFTEKKRRNNIFQDKIDYSFLFVFKFDNADQVIEQKVIDLSKRKNLLLNEDKTKNNIIERGIIEKFFGGVGAQNELPTTP